MIHLKNEPTSREFIMPDELNTEEAGPSIEVCSECLRVLISNFNIVEKDVQRITKSYNQAANVVNHAIKQTRLIEEAVVSKVSRKKLSKMLVALDEDMAPPNNLSGTSNLFTDLIKIFSGT